MDIKGLSTQAIKNIYDGFDGLVEPSLFQLTSEVLQSGISQGVIEFGTPNPAFLTHMQKTGVWFSARKTYEQQQQLAKLLMSDDGKTKRTWRDFKAKAQSVVGTYNETWLKTEYNTAIRAARMGSRWQSFADTADLYPNLEYLPSRAANPRPEHKPYYHVIRPIDDDFWVKHYPPSDYNCQCGCEPTDSEVTDVPENGPQPAPGLDHNPGITEAVFSDTHPITERLTQQGADIVAIDAEGERLQAEADYGIIAKRLGNVWASYQNSVKHLMDRFTTLTLEDMGVINGYTGSEFITLNAWLRGKLKAKENPYLEAYARRLQEALLKLPAQPGTVYRGLSMSAEEIAAYSQAKTAKKPVIWTAFSSTSTDLKQAFGGGVIVEIKAKSGRNVMALSDVEKEKEVLLPAGTKLLIKSVKAKKGGLTYIKAEEL